MFIVRRIMRIGPNFYYAITARSMTIVINKRLDSLDMFPLVFPGDCRLHPRPKGALTSLHKPLEFELKG